MIGNVPAAASHSFRQQKTVRISVSFRKNVHTDCIDPILQIRVRFKSIIFCFFRCPLEKMRRELSAYTAPLKIIIPSVSVQSAFRK